MPEAGFSTPELSAAELASLHALCFITPRPWSEREISDLIASPHIFLLLESGGFLMGRALAGEAELLTLAVHPDHRRQGLGQKLVSRFLVAARARAAETSFLEVAASNLGAVSLYHAAGFAAVGRRRGYYRAPDGSQEDAIVMSRAF